MSLSSRAVTVATAPTRLDSTSDLQGEQAVVFYNTSAVTVFIGGATVTTASGSPVEASSWSPSISGLDSTEGLYGIVATGTAEVRVLEVGV